MAKGRNEIRIPPRLPLVPLEALKILVRVPGKPEAVRAFTSDEADEARQYAAEHSGVCEPLPEADRRWDWDAGRPVRGS